MKSGRDNTLSICPAGQLTRREFVKQTTALGIALGVPFLCPPDRHAYAAPKPAAATLASVSGPRVQATIKAVQLLGGMQTFVKKGDRVVLKPNMSFPHPPTRATNTHYEVVATLAKMCLEAGAAKVLVLDYPFNRPEPCLQRSGIKSACAGLDNVFTFAVVEEKFFRPLAVKQGKALREVKVMKDVLECDVLINIPTAKSHTTTGVSLGLKNLMGLIWDRRYFHAGVDINQAIADLAATIKVHLTVLDASRALVTAGPSGPGKIEQPETIVAGTDPVAVDALGVTLASWYGQRFTGSQVKHIVASQAMGLGTMDLEKVNLLKDAA